MLEPSCGDGAFFEAVEREGLPSLKRITAFELDREEAAKARTRTSLKPKVFDEDFLSWYLTNGQSSERFDAVVGNLPFIRYQYLPAKQQLLAEKIFALLGLPFTKHTNAWVPFVLASLNVLRPGGRLAMVIPSELFHIPHAQSLRRYLVAEYSKVLIYDPEEIWFDDTLQGTVLLLAEKKQTAAAKSQGVTIVPIAGRQTLRTNPERAFRENVYTNGVTIEGKWMPVFLSVAERNLLAEARNRPDIKTIPRASISRCWNRHRSKQVFPSSRQRGQRIQASTLGTSNVWAQ